MSHTLVPGDLKAAETLYNQGSTWEKCAAGARIFQALKKARCHSSPVEAEEFSVQIDEKLPLLAWICEIRGSRYSFTAGAGVEHGQSFMVEGAWDGEFGDADFAASDHFYGSGASLDKNGICVFTPPRQCTDYLFILRDKERSTTWVSNSFNFIFARAGINQESEFYRRFRANLNPSTNAESALGADRGDPLIARADQFSMRRMMFHNFTVDESGRASYLMRLPARLAINDFASYRRFLLERTSALLANGSSSLRKKPFGAVTMLSTGYDSCAASAICAQCGVQEAVTLDVTKNGHSDCGAKIAHTLELHCHITHSPLTKNTNSRATHIDDLMEFVATAGMGDNLAFRNMEPVIAGKLVFSGLYGDGCWSKDGFDAGLAHHLPYMKSRMEFRLRTGYCLIPVPAFGAYFPYALKRVNSGADMLPFALNNSYDRPIPRRIAEEAGVPRELFGMRKMANNPNIINLHSLFDEAVRSMMRRY